MDRIGNYRIDAERSREATGVIYEARHLVLPRRAIIKVMQAKLQMAAVQLLREACILEALEHPGVIRVYESGLLPDRRAWFAHERVEGATVADLFVLGPSDPAHASVLLRDLAEVLEHVHRRGVIHGGLRPDLVAVTGRTRGFPLCITDWSDARTLDTSTPPPVRSAAYAAPELVEAGPIDDRTDVFALGVIGYQALTGALPFPDAWRGQRAPHHVPTQVRCPNAPGELTTLIDQMLAREHLERPTSAEAHADLAAIAAELSPPASKPIGSPRIRKPKWTPALPVGDGLPDIVADDVTDDKLSE